MFLSDSLIFDFVSLIGTLLIVLIIFFKWKYQYWQRRGVQFLEPKIPFGNIEANLRGKEHRSLTVKRIYEEMKSRGWKYGGAYAIVKPHFFVIDLDLVRNILTKDFQYFADRDFYHNDKEPLQAHLVNLTGAKWRNLRAKLTPTFTSGKMKMMFNIMAECQPDLEKRMDAEVAKNAPIDIKEILACFTTNIIGSCAFGLEFKALEDDNSAFRQIGRKMFQMSKWQRYKRLFGAIFPELAKLIDLKMNRKEITDFILEMVQDTINYREKNNVTRNDFMQLMINLKNNVNESEGHGGKPFTLNDVASQCIVFFGAGFETSSTLMTFALYELAKNPEIQDKLRNEIVNVLEKHNNEITYDSIQDMTYLSQVIDETLRKHPPGAQTARKCVKDYKLPNENVIIEKGTKVSISILAIHYDKDYYPDPEKFDPERFNEKNKQLRHNFAHLPFGEGPRNCIGMRFGLLQSKVGLVALVKNYKFTVNSKTQDPLVYKTNSVVLAAKGEIWLNAQKIEKVKTL